MQNDFLSSGNPAPENPERDTLKGNLETYFKDILSKYPSNTATTQLDKCGLIVPLFEQNVIIIKREFERSKPKITVTINYPDGSKPYSQRVSPLLRDDTFEGLITDVIMKQLHDKGFHIEKKPWEKQEIPPIKDVKGGVRDEVNLALALSKLLHPESLKRKGSDGRSLADMLGQLEQLGGGRIPPAPDSKKSILDMGGFETLLPLLMGGNPDVAKILGSGAGKQVKAFLEGLRGEFSAEDFMKGIGEVVDTLGKIGEKMSEKKSLDQAEKIIVSRGIETGELILSPQTQEQIDMLIEILNNPEEIKAMNISVPKGYILQGSPGCGKTSVMRMIANRVNPDTVVIFRLEPNMYRSFLLSQGEKGFAALLESIKNYAKVHGKHAVIFMDEFEDIARKRGNTHEAYAKELNILLRFLDGIETNTDITFIGATNVGIDELDPAIIRGGRCSTIMKLERPDGEQVDTFIQNFMKNKKDLIGIDSIGMYNGLKDNEYSYGDIEEILNIALRRLFMRRRKSPDGQKLKINKSDIEDALKDFKSQRTQLVGYAKK